jgi:small subunit ribosomal protein S5
MSIDKNAEDKKRKKENDFILDEGLDSDASNLEEAVLRIKRCAKVVKGGRRMSFSAVVVVGDHNGRIGFALGKANEVADAIRKATEVAQKSMFQIKLKGSTIPHVVYGKFSASKVFLKPAVEGSGVIAGGSMRALLHLAGVKDVIAKSMGNNDKWNVLQATLDALSKLRTLEEAKALRGVDTVG